VRSGRHPLLTLHSLTTNRRRRRADPSLSLRMT
jgi:hypothetical protein